MTDQKHNRSPDRKSQKERIKEITEKLEEGVKAVFESDRYVEKLLPELVPDGEALTPERRQEKIEAVQERLAKAKAEAEKRAAEYEKIRQTADRNDRGR